MTRIPRFSGGSATELEHARAATRTVLISHLPSSFVCPVIRLACLFILIHILASPGLGQTAILRGQVLDPSGAAVSRATVTLTAAAGLTRSMRSKSDGTYSFSDLTPGEYVL